jgi:flagellar hook-length control protein FliK
MTLDRGSVWIDLRAATPEAQELLNQSLGTLRSSLEARGLGVERLNVHLSPAPTATPAQTRDDGQQQNGMREDARTSTHHDAGGGASRGNGGEQQDDGSHSPGGAGIESDEIEHERAAMDGFASVLRLSLDAVA